MPDAWERCRRNLELATRDLPWGSFVIVDYGRDGHGDDARYVQAAPGPAGWYAEAESSTYLPASAPDPDRRWLTDAGWRPPDRDTLNWWRPAVPPDAIATVLLDALRHGLGCSDPHLVTFRLGRFPSGPRGGEPLPVTTLTPRTSAA